MEDKTEDRPIMDSGIPKTKKTFPLEPGNHEGELWRIIGIDPDNPERMKLLPAAPVERAVQQRPFPLLRAATTPRPLQQLQKGEQWPHKTSVADKAAPTSVDLMPEMPQDVQEQPETSKASVAEKAPFARPAVKRQRTQATRRSTRIQMKQKKVEETEKKKATEDESEKEDGNE